VCPAALSLLLGALLVWCWRGPWQAKIVKQEILKSGLLVLLNGAIAAAAAYFVGWGLAEALNVKGEC
jgi:hypothetical protein